MPNDTADTDTILTYTTEQVAGFFDVTTYTVRKWIEKGKFPGAFKDKGSWVVPKEEVVSLLMETYADDEPIVGI